MSEALANVRGRPAETSRGDEQPVTEALSPSLDVMDGHRSIRGVVDSVSRDVVCGWLLDLASPDATQRLEIRLDGVALCEGRTGIERADIDKVVGAHSRCGFRIDLAQDVVREAAALALKRACAVGGSVSATDRVLSLRLSLASERVIEGGETLFIRFPGDFKTERTLAEWASFFDLEVDELRREAERHFSRTGLTPVDGLAHQRARYIAFYLPQFHRVSENDAWWGPGFTDWVNVASAGKQFETHQAPPVPADLGFYDLLSTDTRRRQGELASQYGIYGFCYYFYWFSGRRILERPLELILKEREPSLPFCLCWANENWSRRWDGSETDVLIEQRHDAKADVAILDALAPFFRDDRYIRIDGKLLFIVYRMSLMPDPQDFVARLRSAARDRGLGELFVCNVMSFGDRDPNLFGCDSAVQFPPHGIQVQEAPRADLGVPRGFTGKIFDYNDVVASGLTGTGDFPVFPGVMPRWDNSPRKGSAAHIFVNSTPGAFETWLRLSSLRAIRSRPEAPLVFINSWNEWGEGAHLEPDRDTGRTYLEAVRRVAANDPRHRLAAVATAADGDRAAEMAALNASLVAENQLLSARLAALGSLTAPDQLWPGFPETLSRLTHDANGEAKIEFVNTQRLRPQVSARRDQPVFFSGWFFSRTPETRSESFSYLVLASTGGKRTYFAIIAERTLRPDIAGHFGTDPEAPYGFSVRLDCGSAEPGVYAIRMVEVNGGIATHCDPQATLLLA